MKKIHIVISAMLFILFCSFILISPAKSAYAYSCKCTIQDPVAGQCNNREFEQCKLSNENCPTSWSVSCDPDGGGSLPPTIYSCIRTSSPVGSDCWCDLQCSINPPPSACTCPPNPQPTNTPAPSNTPTRTPTSTRTPTPTPTTTPNLHIYSCTNLIVTPPAGSVYSSGSITYSQATLTNPLPGDSRQYFIKYEYNTEIGSAHECIPTSSLPCTFNPGPIATGAQTLKTSLRLHVIIPEAIPTLGTYRRFICDPGGVWLLEDPPDSNIGVPTGAPPGYGACVNTCTAEYPIPTNTPPPQYYCSQNKSITLPSMQSVNAGTIQFKIKFQGILFDNIKNTADRQQKVKIALIKQIANPAGLGQLTVWSKIFPDSTVTASAKDEKGIAIWYGTLNPTDVPPGTGYSVLIKGPKHLQKKICVNTPSEQIEQGLPYRCLGAGQITLATTENAFSFSDILLQAGDLPVGSSGQDGVVNAVDVSYILNILKKGTSTNQPELQAADIDLNGIVNAKDRSYLIETLEEKYGDEE